MSLRKAAALWDSPRGVYGGEHQLRRRRSGRIELNGHLVVSGVEPLPGAREPDAIMLEVMPQSGLSDTTPQLDFVGERQQIGNQFFGELDHEASTDSAEQDASESRGWIARQLSSTDGDSPSGSDRAGVTDLDLGENHDPHVNPCRASSDQPMEHIAELVGMATNLIVVDVTALEHLHQFPGSISKAPPG